MVTKNETLLPPCLHYLNEDINIWNYNNNFHAEVDTDNKNDNIYTDNKDIGN